MDSGRNFQYPGILSFLVFAFNRTRSIQAWSIRGAGEMVLEQKEGARKPEMSQNSMQSQ